MEIAALFTPENGLAGAIGGAAIWILRSKALEIIANQNVQKADSEDIKERTQRLEFILTGDKGENGVRQQVKDLSVEMKGAKTDIEHIKNTLATDAAVLAAKNAPQVRQNRGRRKSQGEQ